MTFFAFNVFDVHGKDWISRLASRDSVGVNSDFWIGEF